MQTDHAPLIKQAKEILKQNDREHFTVPAGELYPHQWLWDSCFIAIGLRNFNIERAKKEIYSLLRGQWSNGMVPNIVFSSGKEHRRDHEIWRSYLSPYSPDNVPTSGITQPPMIAEAVVKIGEKLKLPERRTWYKSVYEPLLNYHKWLYNDRDPHKEGLIILIHPYECGLDNSPPWISEMRKHSMPKWLRLMEKLHLAWIISLFRRDTQHITISQRIENIDAAIDWAALYRLRRHAYNSEAILNRPLFAVEDLVFNSILVRANKHLQKIAEAIGVKIPQSLLDHMHNTESAIEKLWDERTGQYYSRSFISHKLIEEPSIATFMPLYAGVVSQEKAKLLVELMRSKRKFGTNWPVPSVPRDSAAFNPYRYWQGPTWVNTNWLVINGLEQYGFDAEAQMLRERTIDIVRKSGMYEYFNPLNGDPAGAPNFSWTAALTLDLLEN